MALNRRRFVRVSGILGAGRLFGQLPANRPSQLTTFRVLNVSADNGHPISGTYAYDLNNVGHLTGTFDDPETQSLVPFLFRPNSTMTAGEFASVSSLIGESARRLTLIGPPAINNTGVLAGSGSARSGGRGARFVYRLIPPQAALGPWEFERGPDLSQGYVGDDVRISVRGDAVFCVRPLPLQGNAEARVFVWLQEKQDYVDLGPAAPNFRITGCTRDGARLIICGSGSQGGESEAVRIEYDVVSGAKDLRILSHSANRHCQALGMNDRGDIVGSCLTQIADGFAERAFQRSENHWHVTLGTLGGTRGVAYSVNDWGDVVGHSERADPAGGPIKATAFLFRRYKLIDLTTLLGDATPTALSKAQLLINDRGYIAGNVDGPYAPACKGEHSFLLVPSPLNIG